MLVILVMKVSFYGPSKNVQEGVKFKIALWGSLDSCVGLFKRYSILTAHGINSMFADHTQTKFSCFLEKFCSLLS